jgi:anti-anti-sigma regulatory factor
MSTEDGGVRTLELHGRLTGQWVAELEREILRSSRSLRLRLDLAGVQFADGRGVQLLRDLRRDGAELLQCSEFIAALVNGGSEWVR